MQGGNRLDVLSDSGIDRAQQVRGGRRLQGLLPSSPSPNPDAALGPLRAAPTMIWKKAA
jgi:hypothetical protein